MEQITKEELVALNSTIKKLYEQAQYFKETGGDRDMLAEILERIHQQFDNDPDDGPEDFSGLPYAVEKLIEKCDLLKGEVVTAGNYAACRLNVLREIQSILGTDGLRNEAMSTVTGVPPQLARLPKRIKQLSADVTTWRERYDTEVREIDRLRRQCQVLSDKNQDLLRENETLARNVPPESPPDDPIFWNPYNGAVQDHRDGTIIQPDTDKERAKRGLPPLEYPPVPIGQAWCRTENRHPRGCLVLGWGNNAVLCNVYQDVMTGAVTYAPIPFDELPHVGKAEAP
jgi:hypothetical protein